jgi:hypothetical protein
MHPEELKEILRMFEGVTHRTIEDGAIPIDATQPLARVADSIIAHIRAGWDLHLQSWNHSLSHSNFVRNEL